MAGVKIVALAGGVGGAKMAHGLAQVLQPQQLTVIVNTADDFTHLGLRISPDLDTVCYTLAGQADPERGWGRKNETWNVLSRLKEMGRPDWFQLGDTDLATHLYRTERLAQGKTLSQVTAELGRMMGISVQVLPMSDDLIKTRISSDEGELEFQEYFVHRRCEPVVQGIEFVGADSSKPAPGVLESIHGADAVIFCPSNPWVSIDPILSVPGIRQTVEGKLTLAISPIIGSQA
ncbi:MAG: 2-phospho-L-lactate transferase, partial [Acidobacteriaceae bacterium]